MLKKEILDLSFYPDYTPKVIGSTLAQDISSILVLWKSIQ